MIPIHAEVLHANVKFSKQLKTAPHRLSKEEVQKIIENASLQRKSLYFFLLSSGVRGEEACSLKKRDFELFNGRYKINLRGSYTKTGMPRITFISKETQKYLEPLLKKLKDDDLVFTENSDPIKARLNEDVYFHRLRKKLDLVARHETGRHEITLHSFRSYFISHCEKINEGLGHALAGHDRYMKVYERYSDEELLEFYLKIEPELLIFDSDEIIKTHAELKAKVEEMEKEMKENNAKFEKFELGHQLLQMLAHTVQGTGVQLVTPDGKPYEIDPEVIKKVMKDYVESVEIPIRISPMPAG